MDAQLLGALCATCVLISIMPGLCTILCLTLATTIGLRRTQWMILGEVAGMGSVAAAMVLGVAAVLQIEPTVVPALKAVGGAYLLFQGWKTWQNAPIEGLALSAIPKKRMSLAALGYVTAISNPKVWILYLALLPPFVNPKRPIPGQLSVMLAVIVLVELSALYLYALGGRMAARVLVQGSSRVRIGRGLGVLLAAMGVWILLR